MLPIGLIFGVLTTRSLIRRIERLASATSKFTEGDYSQRVPIARPDEIGQLEAQFNQMAEQLVDSFDQRQALAELSVRREERARIEQEMSSAYYIQQSLLPEQVPSIPGWQIKPFYRPAREVGGDLYDFLALPDSRIGLVIGDVTGKGIPAALIMATTTAMIRAAAPQAASPGEVLALINNLLHIHMPSGMFTTCFYAILDPTSGRLCFANAGHNVPYLSHNGKIKELRARGMPLGLMPDQSYPENEVIIAPDDLILLYTDGLVEAHDTGREMFGFPRLKRLMQEHSQEDGLIERLLDELEHFTGEGWDQEDDVTFVMLRNTSGVS
jgi:serine phosphatase RsbU (regulator of sigma subunit)